MSFPLVVSKLKRGGGGGGVVGRALDGRGKTVGTPVAVGRGGGSAWEEEVVAATW